MFILASNRSFNPKVKIIAFVLGMIGAILYVIYGFTIRPIVIGIIALDSVAFFIYIYGIWNCVKYERKNRKTLNNKLDYNNKKRK